MRECARCMPRKIQEECPLRCRKKIIWILTKYLRLLFFLLGKACTWLTGKANCSATHHPWCAESNSSLWACRACRASAQEWVARRPRWKIWPVRSHLTTTFDLMTANVKRVAVQITNSNIKSSRPLFIGWMVVMIFQQNLKTAWSGTRVRKTSAIRARTTTKLRITLWTSSPVAPSNTIKAPKRNSIVMKMMMRRTASKLMNAPWSQSSKYRPWYVVS